MENDVELNEREDGWMFVGGCGRPWEGGGLGAGRGALERTGVVGPTSGGSGGEKRGRDVRGSGPALGFQKHARGGGVVGGGSSLGSQEKGGFRKP